jgi:hypothetical protein
MLNKGDQALDVPTVVVGVMLVLPREASAAPNSKTMRSPVNKLDTLAVFGDVVVFQTDAAVATLVGGIVMQPCP